MPDRRGLQVPARGAARRSRSVRRRPAPARARPAHPQRPTAGVAGGGRRGSAEARRQRERPPEVEAPPRQAPRRPPVRATPRRCRSRPGVPPAWPGPCRHRVCRRSAPLRLAIPPRWTQGRQTAPTRHQGRARHSGQTLPAQAQGPALQLPAQAQGSPVQLPEHRPPTPRCARARPRGRRRGRRG